MKSPFRRSKASGTTLDHVDRAIANGWRPGLPASIFYRRKRIKRPLQAELPGGVN